MTSESNNNNNENFKKLREKVCDLVKLKENDFEVINLLSKNDIVDLIRIMNIQIEVLSEIIISNK
jgi:hypothetical protein